jgi:SpoVK/Ycf46/Vps4 family AAA+-type ATPase
MSWQQTLEHGNSALQKNVSLLFGNVDDLFESSDKTEKKLTQYLLDETYKDKDIALVFNIGTGIKFRDEASRQAWDTLLNGYDAFKGTQYKEQLPADSGEIFRLLHRFFHIISQDKKKKIALIIDHAELLIPAEELNELTLSDKKVLVTLLEWASSKKLLAAQVSITLISDSLHVIHPMIVADSDIAKVEIPFPSPEEVHIAVQKFGMLHEVKIEAPIDSIAKQIHGLNRKGVYQLCLAHQKQTLHPQAVSHMKKEMIEKEHGELIEFIESKKSLDQVAGHTKVVARLREDASLILKGKSDAVPMGYLVCGPVGTGKSYIAECFAGEIGIPVVKIKNFRDRWVGATEANWEKIVTLLKNLAPVLVIVDEADAALGNREQEGDSGTSKRVFASLAQTMGDTSLRGKLVWMLLTARPELLPIDLKRQGRAEVHLPLFYPQTIQEKRQFFEIIGKKLNLITINPLVQSIDERELAEIQSGADVEAILVKVKRWEYIKGQDITLEEFRKIIHAFRASISKEDINHQVQMALAEVTDRDLLEG